jgi:hypothetical protein
MTTGKTKRGLDSPRTGRIIFWWIAGICALLAAADLLYRKHVHYPFESWFAFYGAYGFICCFFLVMAARGLRKLVMRDEDYYDRDYR